jgi:predicted aspartyl protease
MLRLCGAPFCTGVSYYLDHEPLGRSDEARIWVRVGASAGTLRWLALVDTGAPWCIVDGMIADALRLTTHEDAGLETRFGLLRGELHRVPVMLFADEGEPLIIDATVFASARWTGPNVIGYHGFLERLRFAVDPGARGFYFGKL